MAGGFKGLGVFCLAESLTILQLRTAGGAGTVVGEAGAVVGVAGAVVGVVAGPGAGAGARVGVAVGAAVAVGVGAVVAGAGLQMPARRVQFLTTRFHSCTVG